MPNVIERTTLEFHRSVSAEPGSSDPAQFPEPPNGNWKHSPNLDAVAGVLQKYWDAPADWDVPDAGPIEMSLAEKGAVDAEEAAALLDSNRATSAALPDDTETPLGWEIRALIELVNQRDNYVVNRLEEMQADLQAIKASSGPADNIRAAIRVSYLATGTRTRADAVQDYKDEINSGGADS